MQRRRLQPVLDAAHRSEPPAPRAAGCRRRDASGCGRAMRPASHRTTASSSTIAPGMRHQRRIAVRARPRARPAARPDTRSSKYAPRRRAPSAISSGSDRAAALRAGNASKPGGAAPARPRRAGQPHAQPRPACRPVPAPEPTRERRRRSAAARPAAAATGGRSSTAAPARRSAAPPPSPPAGRRPGAVMRAQAGRRQPRAGADRPIAGRGVVHGVVELRRRDHPLAVGRRASASRMLPTTGPSPLLLPNTARGGRAAGPRRAPPHAPPPAPAAPPARPAAAPSRARMAGGGGGEGGPHRTRSPARIGPARRPALQPGPQTDTPRMRAASVNRAGRAPGCS